VNTQQEVQECDAGVPQTPKEAFETIQNELADFFDTVQGSDTTGAKWNYRCWFPQKKQVH
jgi:hypothetical protein